MNAIPDADIPVTAGSGTLIRAFQRASAVSGRKLTGKGSTFPLSWDFPFVPALNTQAGNCPVLGVQVF